MMKKLSTLTFAVLLIALLSLALTLPALESPGEQTDDFSTRRQQLITHMGEGIALLSSQATRRNRMQDNKFFYYLTGVTDRNAILLIVSGEKSTSTLYNTSGEWNYDMTQGDLECLPMSKLQQTLYAHARNRTPVFASFQDLDLLKRAGGNRNPFVSSKKMINLDTILQDMRVIKSDYEIACLTKAIDITAESLVEVFKAATPGLKEYDLAAILEYHYKRKGSSGSTFLQAASGPNSTFVHFGAGDRVLQDGDMIVFDVGAAYKNYTSDITRSIPAGGRFTAAQKEIYSLVLKSQKAAIKEMLPGNTFGAAQKVAEDILMQGLVDLGLVFDLESAWQKRLFIQHGFYHFIGLDVHDVWYSFAPGVKQKQFQPGMVITMEPGLYFPKHMLDALPRRIKAMVDEETFTAFVKKIRPIYMKYANIGVRIEDDVLITNDGNKILSTKAPKEINDIEKVMQMDSPHKRNSP